MNSSTGLPALTISMILRGRLSSPTISSMECAPMTLCALGRVVQELVHLGDRAVEGDHGKAVVVHVQNQVLAHDGQTDQCDVCRLFHDLLQPVAGRREAHTTAWVEEALGEVRAPAENLREKLSDSRCQSPL